MSREGQLPPAALDEPIAKPTAGYLSIPNGVSGHRPFVLMPPKFFVYKVNI